MEALLRELSDRVVHALRLTLDDFELAYLTWVKRRVGPMRRLATPSTAIAAPEPDLYDPAGRSDVRAPAGPGADDEGRCELSGTGRGGAGPDDDPPTGSGRAAMLNLGIAAAG